MNEYISLTLENVESEHLCCAIADKKHEDGVLAKREWLKKRIEEGHVFRKANVRGKVFIEYAPLEKAWVPVIGDNFLYIYCLWVAGSYKGNGYGKDLLKYAIEEAKRNGKKGICTISSKKKKPYVSEKSFFLQYGFEVVDQVGDYELLSLSFQKEKPTFTETAKKMEIDRKELTIYYSSQCPYVENCIHELQTYKEEKKIPIFFEKVDTLEKAKNMPCVFNNWATFLDGKYVSASLLNQNMVDKLLS